MDAIHSSRIFGWIEQPNVAFVHMQVGEPAVCGSLAQDVAAVSIPLDGHNGSVSEDEISEQSATGSGE